MLFQDYQDQIIENIYNNIGNKNINAYDRYTLSQYALPSEERAKEIAEVIIFPAIYDPQFANYLKRNNLSLTTVLASPSTTDYYLRLAAFDTVIKAYNSHPSNRQRKSL